MLAYNIHHYYNTLESRDKEKILILPSCFCLIEFNRSKCLKFNYNINIRIAITLALNWRTEAPIVASNLKAIRNQFLCCFRKQVCRLVVPCNIQTVFELILSNL